MKNKLFFTVLFCLVAGLSRILAAGLVVNSYIVGVPAGAGSFAQIQKKVYASTGSITPHAVTFTSTPTLNKLCIWAVTSDNTLASTPAGLTLAGAGKLGSTWTAIYYRVNGGSESATVSFALNLGTPDSFSCIAFEYDGMATASPLDLAPAGVTYGGAPGPSTGSTGTLGQADELAIVIFSNNVTPGTTTATWGASTGTFVDEGGGVSTGSSTNVKAFVASCKTTTTAALNAALTPSANVTGEGVIVTFKITSP